ncbi:aminotransferase family protein (LolT), putative [Talaromyces stipitatus ATCC 10500]|uniref:Aminotransferase family protein (LolT), putative n=1 Tax=Talaromyces stipitatus (strain ATCC 10500 / CBS 375.48 / QM 6759 / NRRL 1006) TaxID=441959 RepID=B8M963_TALSN|nr:aminotransferase family protein (LolT), putative [Talaromyces stipitatus ATCC 10500]EED17358.1 aminotransferase family protein (LolT), putative [Talaromyces stipitatus ATCC 10500]
MGEYIASPDGPTAFGRNMLRKHFMINPRYRPLNHGSFGTFPVQVRDAQRKLQDEQESRPDVFFVISHAEHVTESRKAIANLVHAPVDECVFVKNASTGINTILRNLDFKQGDVIVYFATVYNAVEQTLESLMETTPVQTRRVSYTFPITHDEILKKFLAVVKQTKSEGQNVRVAIFDTIVSVPGVRFPFEKLIKACTKESILSVIDGAHGVGQIPLYLGDLSPDFFVSNCHKWLYTPRGCALLYVPKRNQHLLRTSFPTSHGYTSPADRGRGIHAGKSDFEILFEFVATADDTPYMCVPAALDFRKRVCGGEAAIYTYLHTIAQEGGDVVARILGTDVMQEPGLSIPIEQSDIRRCAMTNVRMPLAFKDDKNVNRHVPDPSSSPFPLLSIKDATPVTEWMQAKLIQEFDTFAKFYPHGGWLWLRLSGQIYLEIEDFEWIGHIARSLCERVASGEWLHKSRI